MTSTLTLTASAKAFSLATPRVDCVCVDWMSDKDSEDNKRSKLLSDALRAVRDIRKPTTQDLADALGLSRRGYQHFEAGGGKFNIDHVMAFARAIDCDPFGVMASVEIGRPEFAAWVAQNKAMIAFMITLREFADDTGEAMSRLETTTWVSAYRAMFKDLSEKARIAQAQNDTWLTENAAKLGLGVARSDPQGQTDAADGDDPATRPKSADEETS
jgi:transcriptional regulator with XRE-family HTH domain